jgi:hypothetical protein
MLSQAGIYGDLLSAVTKQKIHSREISFFFSFFYSTVMAVWPILYARLPGRRRNKIATSYIRWSRYRAPVEKEKVYFASPAVISTRWGRVEKKSQCKPRPVCIHANLLSLGIFSRWWAKLREKRNSDRARAHMSKAELAELKCVCVCTAVTGFVFWLLFLCVCWRVLDV